MYDRPDRANGHGVQTEAMVDMAISLAFDGDILCQQNLLGTSILRVMKSLSMVFSTSSLRA